MYEGKLRNIKGDLMQKFNSELELYKKVLPALRTKKHELIRDHIEIVNEKDIWNFNKLNKWRNEDGLTLAKMVDDILNTVNEDYYEYKLNKIKNQGE